VPRLHAVRSRKGLGEGGGGLGAATLTSLVPVPERPAFHSPVEPVRKGVKNPEYEANPDSQDKKQRRRPRWHTPNASTRL
jgi:hypothetical protein